VRAIKLEGDDEVVAMELAEQDEELFVVTQNGFGKRTAVEDYKLQARGGKGLLTYDKAKFKKTGALIGAMVVNEDDEILLINSDGVIIRINAGEVSKLGRATQGVKIMKVGDSTNIIAMAKVIREDDEDDDANGDGPGGADGQNGAKAQGGAASGEQLALDTD
jgi:DNA gyrase subunit A